MEPRPESSGMELRTYLDVLRRRRVLIVLVTVVVGVVAFIASTLQAKVFSAEAKVLLRTGDAAEQINQTSQYPISGAQADRYLASQLDVIRGEVVAQGAADLLPGSNAKELIGQVQVKQSGATDIILVTGSASEPRRAADIANAFSRAYIENRRLNAVAGLDRASVEIGAKLDELTARIAELDSQIQREKDAAAREEAKKLPGQRDLNATTPLMETLTAARSAAALQYQSLYAQQQNLLVNKSLKKGEAELIEEAKAPASPASPRPKRSATFGLTIGLLLGLLAAFLREQLDDRIHSREQAEEISKLPVLAELPYDGQSAKDSTRLTAQEFPSSVLAEAARGLRTSLTFLGVDKPLRRIVVTSAGPAEGKSFVTSNLGAVYAQAGLRTVIVSGDLRRPRIDTIFPEAANQGPGLTGVIAAFAAAKNSGAAATSTLVTNGSRSAVNGSAGSGRVRVLSEAVRPTRVKNLFLVPVGKLPPNPAELLSSTWCDQVLDALGDVADVVVVDAPPTLVVTDAALLATNADGVIIVAAASETTRGALTRATAALAKSHARLLGVVLNKVDKSKGSTYYGFGTYSSEPVKSTSSRRRWRRHKEDLNGDSAAVIDETVGAGVS